MNQRFKKAATRRTAPRWVGVSLFALVAACHGDPARQQTAAAQVSVLAVTPQAIAAHIRYEGQALASKHVDVRSQVTGVIVARPYVEGVDVSAGALLFKIDPTLYKAAYDNALGQLASAQSRAANAERSFARLRPLLAERAVAQQDVDNAEAALQQARADVQAAQGAVDQAKKNLDDTDVRAQIGGRAGIAQLVLGSRVTGPGDLLTTIDQVDPIYVQFNPSDQDVLTWRREIAAKRLAMPGGRLRVRSILADSTVMPGTGTLTFADIAIQQQTGTQTLRATIPNPEHILLPGQFVRVELLDLKRTGAFLVPQRAVQQGVAGSYVYTVTDSNTVTPRNVSASVWEGSAWVIEDGLRVGDRVVVDDIRRSVRARACVLCHTRRPGIPRDVRASRCRPRRGRRSSEVVHERGWTCHQGRVACRRSAGDRVLLRLVTGVLDGHFHRDHAARPFRPGDLPVNTYPNITPPSSTDHDQLRERPLSRWRQQWRRRSSSSCRRSTACSTTRPRRRATGRCTINCFFDISRDQDLAAVDVQNVVEIAKPLLPQDVQRVGVTVQKAQTNILLAIGFTSDDPRWDAAALSNYSTYLHAGRALARARRRPGDDVRQPAVLNAGERRPAQNGDSSA